MQGETNSGFYLQELTRCTCVFTRFSAGVDNLEVLVFKRLRFLESSNSITFVHTLLYSIS